MNLIQIINMAEPKPAARGMLAKQLSWQAMYQRTKKALDNMFINIQNMDTNMQNMRIERDQALEQVKRLQQRNLQLWDTYVARGAQNAQEAPTAPTYASNEQSSTQASPRASCPSYASTEDCSVAAMAAKDAHIEMLRAKLDKSWQPIENEEIGCVDESGSAVALKVEPGRITLAVWAKIIALLPYDVRVCRLTPESVKGGE